MSKHHKVEPRRKPLGRVIHAFSHDGRRYVVVQNSRAMTVVRDYEDLLVTDAVAASVASGICSLCGQPTNACLCGTFSEG